MPAPIDFYFDFSSPYGYLAAQRIDAVAAGHGRMVEWRPFLLGIVFKTTGSQPLLDIPLKGPYARRDLARTARRFGVPFVIPSPFPFSAVAPARAFYWLRDRDAAQAVAFAKAAYHAAFGKGRDISGVAATVALVAAVGGDATAASAALADAGVKERLRAENDAAIARGVFGSPFMVVDGEPFWGADRLADVDAWLASGGW